MKGSIYKDAVHEEIHRDAFPFSMQASKTTSLPRASLRDLESDLDYLFWAACKAIPAEIKRERAGIFARYASPQARLFPVAITYVVPEGAV